MSESPEGLYYKLSRGAVHSLYALLPDKVYLNWLFYRQYHRFIDWNNPKTFNEKLQWLKVYDHNPLYTTLVDKLEAKKYVGTIIGEDHIIPTYGVWDHFDDIDFDKLPDRFVLKCTHDSGSIVICKDKESLNKTTARKELEAALKNKYWQAGREWAYKNVPPRIIAEKYIEISDGRELVDYKLMCFGGKVKCSFVCSDRFIGDNLKVTFYDTEWNIMPFERHYPKSSVPIERPVNYEQMVEFAEKLTQEIPFCRVDFYEVDGITYFGEMTFYPGGGLEEFTPDSWDYELGSWINLPVKN